VTKMSQIAALSDRDWDLIHDLANLYYAKHGALINEIITMAPKTPGLRDALLMKMSDMSSVYSHDIKD
jgi:hypothetical protein